MQKKTASFRLPPDLLEWMANQEKSQAELVIDGITLLSEIEIKIIEELAEKYRCRPGLIVDIAVRYFSKLDEEDRLKKIWDYWEEKRLEAIAREQAEKQE